MKFWEAAKLYDDGKKIRGTWWHPEAWISLSGEGGNIPSLHFSCLISQEWELFEEPQKLVSFPEVVKGICQAKKFRRKTWKAGVIVGYSECGTRLLWEDFEATDWIEVK